MEPTQEELMRLYEKDQRRKEQNRINQRAFQKNRKTEMKVDKIRLGNLIEDNMKVKYKKLKRRVEVLEEENIKNVESIRSIILELEKI